MVSNSALLQRLAGFMLSSVINWLNMSSICLTIFIYKLIVQMLPVSFDVVKTCNLEGQASVVTPVSSPYLAGQLSSSCS